MESAPDGGERGHGIQTRSLDDEAADRGREPQVEAAGACFGAAGDAGTDTNAARVDVARPCGVQLDPGREGRVVAPREAAVRSRRSSSPPSRPAVSSTSAPGRNQPRMSAHARCPSMSWRLTPTMSARDRSGDGQACRCVTRSPATRRRRMPCQPNATQASWTAGRPTRPAARWPRGKHPGWCCPPLVGHARDRQRSPRTEALLDPARPAAHGCGRRDRWAAARARASTPASYQQVELPRLGREASTPTSAPVRIPSRAHASAPYVTPPPSRQPRGSDSSMSRAAEPTTTMSGTPARAWVHAAWTIGPPLW